MTEQELDEKLGVPKHSYSCQRCTYSTRPFYSAAVAKERIMEHYRWKHSSASGEDR